MFSIIKANAKIKIKGVICNEVNRINLPFFKYVQKLQLSEISDSQLRGKVNEKTGMRQNEC